MRRAALLLAATASLASCGGPPPPPPPAALDLTIIASASQNPDQSGHPAPVAVRLLFLASDAAFQRADVFALTEREQATLGPDDLGSQEILIRPGETKHVEAKPRPGVAVLGAIVLFRDIDHATWRTEAPLAPSGPTRLTLSIAGLTARLAPTALRVPPA